MWELQIDDFVQEMGIFLSNLIVRLCACIYVRTYVCMCLCVVCVCVCVCSAHSMYIVRSVLFVFVCGSIMYT